MKYQEFVQIIDEYSSQNLQLKLANDLLLQYEADPRKKPMFEEAYKTMYEMHSQITYAEYFLMRKANLEKKVVALRNQIIEELMTTYWRTDSMNVGLRWKVAENVYATFTHFEDRINNSPFRFQRYEFENTAIGKSCIIALKFGIDAPAIEVNVLDLQISYSHK